MSPIIVVVGVGAIAVSSAVTLAVLIIGIRRGDRHRLTNAPQSNPDAFARRLLLVVRYPEESSDEEADSR